MQRYFKQAGLPTAGVHVFGTRRLSCEGTPGESVEEVSMFLDHSSLAVTSVYLRRLGRAGGQGMGTGGGGDRGARRSELRLG